MKRFLLLLVLLVILLSSSIQLSSGSSPQVYSVVFNESGLPQNISWYVLLNGTGTTTYSPSITFSEPNGTYTYFVGDSHGFSVTPQIGNVTVSGNNVEINVHFAVSYYNVTFSETGLPTGFIWKIDFVGEVVQTNSTSYEFREYNGSHPFIITSGNSTFRPEPSSGTIAVSGFDVTESIVFSEVEYNVTFVEQGLGPGTAWQVNVSGLNKSTNASTIFFTLTNGSYHYSVSPIEGYAMTSGLLSFTVDGSNLTFKITFTPPEPYTFLVSGLEPGQTWQLEIDGFNYTSNSSFVTVYLFPGNYSYRVQLPYGYSASGTKGTIGNYNSAVIINARNVLLEYTVIIIMIVIVDAILAFYLFRRHSKKGKDH